MVSVTYSLMDIKLRQFLKIVSIVDCVGIASLIIKYSCRTAANFIAVVEDNFHHRFLTTTLQPNRFSRELHIINFPRDEGEVLWRLEGEQWTLVSVFEMMDWKEITWDRMAKVIASISENTKGFYTLSISDRYLI